MIDVFVMIGFGILGYILQKLDFSMSPIVIGIILGPMAETNFRRALILSSGDVSIFYKRPITLTFLVIALLTLFAPIVGPKLKRKKNLAKD
jgi:putative tricarboxylic transport membrane protein